MNTAIGILYEKVKDAKKELATGRRHYREGRKKGHKDHSQGIDMDRGSEYWLSKSDVWHEGYIDGWQESMQGVQP